MPKDSKIGSADVEKLKNLKKSIDLHKKISDSEAESYYDVLEKIGGLSLSNEGDTYALYSADGKNLSKGESIQALSKIISAYTTTTAASKIAATIMEPPDAPPSD